MPKETQVSRQRPVSCSFCRRRKLRCSRDAPCSNCVSRGSECDLSKPAPAALPETTEGSSNDEILQRLRHLEQELIAQKANLSTKQGHDLVVSSNKEQSFVVPTTSEPISLASQIQGLNKDVAELESIYLSDSLSEQHGLPQGKLMLRTCPISIIHQMKQFYYPGELSFTTSTVGANADPVRCIWLPTYGEAQIMLRKYIRVAAHYPWVLHMPSLPGIFEQVYTDIQHQRLIKPGPLLLVLGILACATNSWTAQDLEHSYLASSADTLLLCNFWIRALGDLIHISHEITEISIEGVQGVVLTGFLIIKLEGISRRLRYLFSATFCMARDLGLHRIDHPSNSHKEDSVEDEIGRRVFWYVCSSDWQMSSKFGGTSEGLYHFQPRQIITKRPRHVNDDDMFLEKPLSTPTTMSYPLHRLKLSEICRHMVDRYPLALATSGEPTHDGIMDIDTELQIILNEVQPFFSMSQDELIARYDLSPDRAADIVQQGHTLRFLLHAQRCKLHLPYFTRGYTDNCLAGSKDLCIKSAQNLIQSQAHVLDRGLANGTMFPYAGLLLGVFMASIVLLVDLCMSRSRGEESTPRREVCQAFKLLEGARHESETIARFVDSLTKVLHKHRISPPRSSTKQSNLQRDISASHHGYVGIDQDLPMANDGGSTLMTPDSSAFISISNDLGTTGLGECFGDENFMTSFNDLAQSFEQGQGFNEYDWNNIFSDLNNTFGG